MVMALNFDSALSRDPDLERDLNDWGRPAHPTSATGPTEPVVGRREAGSWRREPVPATGELPPLFGLLGAHGGAGATTLARMWAPAADLDGQWPADRSTTQTVFVVARESLDGIRAAARLLRMDAAGHTPPGVFVAGLLGIAARPGRVPKEIRDYRETVCELLPQSQGKPCYYRIDWCEELMTAPVRLATWDPRTPAQIRPKNAGIDEFVPAPIVAAAERICEDLLVHRADIEERKH